MCNLMKSLRSNSCPDHASAARFFGAWLWMGCLALLRVSLAHANVQATNVRLNGATTKVTANTGTSVIISYLLNEPASCGVT